MAREVVKLTDRPDLILLRNGRWGNGLNTAAIESRWTRSMAQGTAQLTNQSGGGVLSSNLALTKGFSVINTTDPFTYAALPVTAVTNADPAVVSMANTGDIQVGDIVRMSNTTGMLQISGYDFEVTAVTVNASITLNLDASTFAAPATAGNARLIIPNKMYPRRRFISPLNGDTGITQGVSAVVSMSTAHDFTLGEKVRLRVPSAYGMTQANNVLASVVGVTTYTVTLNFDTSGFTAFSLPTSAAYAFGLTPAEIIPAGAGPLLGANPPEVPVKAAFDNRNAWELVMGTNVITTTNTAFDWTAWKYDKYTV